MLTLASMKNHAIAEYELLSVRLVPEMMNDN